MILTLCREFHCLPSQLLAEDARLLQLVKIESWGLERGEYDV
jgi:hypothetical protein